MPSIHSLDCLNISLFVPIMVDHLLQYLLPTPVGQASVTPLPHPQTVSPIVVALTQSSQASPIPVPLPPQLVFLCQAGRQVQSNDDGGLFINRGLEDESDRVPHWSVQHCSSSDWVHLIDRQGRYLSRRERQGEGNEESASLMVGQESVRSRWWLTSHLDAFSGLRDVVLQSAKGGKELHHHIKGARCHERPYTKWSDCQLSCSMMTVELDISYLNHGSTTFEWARRPYSQPLDRSDELDSTTVRLISMDTKKDENQLTAMANTAVRLTSPSSALSSSSSVVRTSVNPAGTAEWILIRTAEPDVVYLRSAEGLYLTGGITNTTSRLLMAPKCTSAKWRMREVQAQRRGGEVDDGHVRVTLQHCDTRFYLQARSRWYRASRDTVRGKSCPQYATPFILLSTTSAARCDPS